MIGSKNLSGDIEVSDQSWSGPNRGQKWVHVSRNEMNLMMNH